MLKFLKVKNLYHLSGYKKVTKDNPIFMNYEYNKVTVTYGFLTKNASGMTNREFPIFLFNSML